jgi:hypothetical protein
MPSSPAPSGLRFRIRLLALPQTSALVLAFFRRNLRMGHGKDAARELCEPLERCLRFGCCSFRTVLTFRHWRLLFMKKQPVDLDNLIYLGKNVVLGLPGFSLPESAKIEKVGSAYVGDATDNTEIDTALRRSLARSTSSSLCSDRERTKSVSRTPRRKTPKYHSTMMGAVLDVSSFPSALTVTSLPAHQSGPLYMSRFPTIPASRGRTVRRRPSCGYLNRYACSSR